MNTVPLVERFSLKVDGHQFMVVHPEKCFVESTKISINPYLNEKPC